MTDTLISLLVDESKWFAPSVFLGIIAGFWHFLKYGRLTNSLHLRINLAMNIIFGVLIFVMSFGHLLAVTIKLIMGTLVGSTGLFYLIGIVLITPAFLLIRTTRRISITGNSRSYRNKLTGINVWLIITILSVGIYNLPLAAPGILNILHSYFYNNRILKQVMVVMAGILYIFLLFGGIIFFLSGQDFETFQGI